MIATVTKFVIKFSFTLCFLAVSIKFFTGLTLSTMNEIMTHYGKKDVFSFLIILSTLNWVSGIQSGFSENFVLNDMEGDNPWYWLYSNIKKIFESGAFLTTVWNSTSEFLMIVILCKRQFTLNSSFFFALSLFVKNFHLPWIENFKDSEIRKDEIPFIIELTSLFSLLSVIYFEANLSISQLNYSKRRLANCVVGSELISIILILKGLFVNNLFLMLSSNLRMFGYGHLHCFYLRIIIFSSLSVSHLLSLINLGLTKKAIFKFYIFTRIFQSIKETIESFSKLNRFRKMNLSIKYSMSSPTQKDLDNLSDQSCIICRDEVTPGNSKKLSCGHIYHVECLQNWMLRQYCCPTCLTDISSKSTDPLHDVNRTRYQSNRAKLDLISFVVGCKTMALHKLPESALCYKTATLPSLYPDLSSIIFFPHGSSKRFESSEIEKSSEIKRIIEIETTNHGRRLIKQFINCYTNPGDSIGLYTLMVSFNKTLKKVGYLGS